ncbi:NAD(P)-dependent oxidoreductase [Dactylosporangium sp. NPDC051541]|uniref:NAD(P)-dependent oxidoreductase n=1 Tax=Dactylosporangium sp. NPDC051541 TaxID=3363977 RepID=UPI0037A79457
MRIAVLGATGATGRHVITAALAAGHEVVALARRPAALDGIEHANLEVRAADVTRPDTVAAAASGADALVSALGISRGGPPDTLSNGARSVLASGVQHVAWLGSLGSGESRHRAGAAYDVILRAVLRGGFTDKATAEALVAGPGTTVFHAVMLGDGPPTGEPRIVALEDLPRWRFMPPSVARADVAAAMVAELEQPAHAGQTVAVY